MNNKEFIKEYIEGANAFGANGHLGYAKDTLFNYSTEICKIDRKKKIANVNGRKYSRTTSDIQTQLRFQLSQKGYTIFTYEGPSAEMWNCGKQGARNVTISDMKG